MSLSFFGFKGWVRRAALPFGFALAVTAGSTVLMRTAISTVDTPAAQPVARVILPPPAEPAPAARGGHPAPIYVRAIEPGTVYAPPSAEKTASNHKVDDNSRQTAAAALPQGVERFDRCAEACDSRDPLIERTNYTDATAPAPAYQVVETPASQESNSLFSLPKWEDGMEMIDRARAAAVSAGSEAVGTMKKAVEGASDFATGLVRPGSASVQ